MTFLVTSAPPPVNLWRCVGLTSTRNPTSTVTTVTMRTTVRHPVRTLHRPPLSLLSSLPHSPVSNSDKNADGSVRLASHYAPASEGSRSSNAHLHLQRRSTSHAHLPSMHSSNMAMTTSNPQISKTPSLNPSYRQSRPLPPLPQPAPPYQQQVHHPLKSRPPPLVLPVAAADLCRCVRRSVDVQRRMRMRWAWSGSLAVNRNVRPRVGQLEVVRKAQNVSGYDLVQPAWRRRLLRHPLRHAQGQALRTGTRLREGHPLIDDNCYS